MREMEKGVIVREKETNVRHGKKGMECVSYMYMHIQTYTRITHTL